VIHVVSASRIRTPTGGLGPVWIRENASFYRQFSTPALEAGIKVFGK
jgi:hypothetical protein